MKRLCQVLRGGAHRSARLCALAAGLGTGRELRAARKRLAACCTAITEIGTQCAVASGKLRVAHHQACTGLTHSNTIEQQPHMGCFSIRAPLPETIHERQLTRGLTVLAELDALLHLRAQLNASTLLHNVFSFREEMAPATRHELMPHSARLVILPSEQQAGLPGIRIRLAWLL
jgi:hypothetical protein